MTTEVEFETAEGIVDSDEDTDNDNEELGIPIDATEVVETTSLPAVELAEPKRGTCRVGGDHPAKDGRSFYCEDHIQYSPSYNRVTPLGAPRGENGRVTDVLGARKKAAVKRFKNFILAHNSEIAKGGQMLAEIPEPWMDSVIGEFTVKKPNGDIETLKLWEPCLREQLSVTEKQAEVLANAMVQFSMSSQGESLAKFMEGFAPYLTLIAAGAVVVQHTIKLNQIKASVKMVKDQTKKAQEQGTEPMSIDPENQETYLPPIDEDLNGSRVA